LLLNTMLIKAKFPPAIISNDNKAKYYACLNKSQSTWDYSLLEDFICDSIIESLKVFE
jgi:hypothetical protein